MHVCACRGTVELHALVHAEGWLGKVPTTNYLLVLRVTSSRALRLVRGRPNSKYNLYEY